MRPGGLRGEPAENSGDPDGRGPCESSFEHYHHYQAGDPEIGVIRMVRAKI